MTQWGIIKLFKKALAISELRYDNKMQQWVRRQLDIFLNNQHYKPCKTDIEFTKHWIEEHKNG